MIYTVTFNPAIDYVMSVGDIDEGKTNRSEKEEFFFGGKGINVSFVLNSLGVDNVALGFIGGFTGNALKEMVEKSGVKTDFIFLKEGNTRINVKLSGKKETEINGKGPEIPNEALTELKSKLDTLKKGDTLVLAGSIPSSLPADVYEKILSRLEGRGIRFIVDAAGKLLTDVLKYKPFLIKPNLQELEEIFRVKLDSEEKIIDYAERLRKQGAENVLVSMGAEGAVLLAADGKIYKRKAFKIERVNSVGAGDSMIAGFIAGCEKGYEYALLLGTASGGATASEKGLATKEDIFRLLETVII